MSSTIRNDVDRVYREQVDLPPEWDPAQRTAFVEQETERLSGLIAETAAQRSDDAIAAWTERTGHAPDYLTTVGLINNAMLQAQEQVLHDELYAQIQPEPEPEQTAEATGEPADSVDWGNPDRWRTPRRSEPSPAVTALVAELWPTRPDLFQIKAEYLLQARSEDGQELPTDPTSPLARQLAELVEDDLRSDDLPLQ